jgi:hypothetical protein
MVRRYRRVSVRGSIVVLVMLVAIFAGRRAARVHAASTAPRLLPSRILPQTWLWWAGRPWS